MRCRVRSPQGVGREDKDNSLAKLRALEDKIAELERRLMDKGEQLQKVPRSAARPP